MTSKAKCEKEVKIRMIQATYELMLEANNADADQDGVQVNDLEYHHASQGGLYGYYSKALKTLGVNIEHTIMMGEIVMKESFTVLHRNQTHCFKTQWLSEAADDLPTILT